ncbi:MAG: hypothetical protein QNL12_05295 [Acidimicrobiia bacterium]|nr:hypothetical protein [Acidimicrobiia bacterium]MDX2466707.1 hypothetical protein [Acidimicrobiia bacterium]
MSCTTIPDPLRDLLATVATHPAALPTGSNLHDVNDNKVVDKVVVIMELFSRTEPEE